MAQEITCPLHGQFIAGPGMKVSVNDISAAGDGAVQTLAHGARWFAAMLYQKAFTAGTGTVSQLYLLKAASNVGFSTFVCTIGSAVVDRADEQSALIQGFAPLQSLQYVRLSRVANGTDAAIYDAIIVGA